VSPALESNAKIRSSWLLSRSRSSAVSFEDGNALALSGKFFRVTVRIVCDSCRSLYKADRQFFRMGRVLLDTQHHLFTASGSPVSCNRRLAGSQMTNLKQPKSTAAVNSGRAPHE